MITHFYEKGQYVPILAPDGQPALHDDGRPKLLPNARGSYMRRVKGKITYLNRAESRRKVVYRVFTQPGCSIHVVREPQRGTYIDPTKSNHQRLLERRKAKEVPKS